MGRTREVPLGREILRTLKEHRHLKGELVFPGPQGRSQHRMVDALARPDELDWRVTLSGRLKAARCE
jgi:integrase